MCAPGLLNARPFGRRTTFNGVRMPERTLRSGVSIENLPLTAACSDTVNSADSDRGPGSKPAEQPKKAPLVERHASGRWRKARPGDMDEYRTAVAGDPRPRIVVDLDHEVVERVVAP